MAKLKKAASERKIFKHRKGKPSKSPVNSAIKKSKEVKNKKQKVKHLRKQKIHNRPRSLDTSSVKNEHNSVKTSKINDKCGSSSSQASQAVSNLPTHNSSSLNILKKVKHKNRKFLLPLRERMLNQLKAARFR